MLAQQLFVTPRTLQNQLKRQGLSFNALSLYERLSRVEEMLKTETDIEVISKKLGYEHVSSFYRAFKSFKGQTFQEYYGL